MAATQHPPARAGDQDENGNSDQPASEQAQTVETDNVNRPDHSVFTKHEKIFIATMASFGAFFSPLSSQIYLPALPAVTQELSITSEQAQLTLTVYVILQGIAPAFMGDLADVGGRRPVYLICFVLYLAACIGIALQDNYAGLLILRCIQSAGSSSTVALAYGVITDLFPSSQRGTFMSMVSMGALLGPAIGPVIGGLLAQYLGWRSIFWFLTVLAGVYFVVSLIFFPETGRSVVGNGSIPPPIYNMSLLNWYKSRGTSIQVSHKRHLKFPNPLRAMAIVVEKDGAVLLAFNSIVFGCYYSVISTIPQIYAQLYGLDDLQIGLCYIPFGVGCIVISFANGRMFDALYRRVAKKAGITIDKKKGDDMRYFPIEKARLPIIFPLIYAGAAITIVYGWVLEINGPLAATLVLLFFYAVCIVGASNAMNMFLVDLFQDTPATASAAGNLVRCAVGAGATAVITIILDRLGRGWGFTLLGFIILASSPALLVLLRFGPRWREERYIRRQEKKEKKKGKDIEKPAGINQLGESK